MDLEKSEGLSAGQAVAGTLTLNADRSVILEQYRLAVEMADRVSLRRGTANSFYFTVSSALLATAESLSLPIAAGAGVLLCGAWWFQLRSYRTLSAAKWTVIGKLEAGLPTHPFRDEWDIIKRDPLERAVNRWPWGSKLAQPLARYTELGVVEQVVPLVFCVLFAISLGRGIG